jgi:hypothetical protein
MSIVNILFFLGGFDEWIINIDKWFEGMIKKLQLSLP